MKSCTTCHATYPSHFSVCPRDGTTLVEAGAWAEGMVIRGKYRIVEKVGQGGMGAVYKASHVMFGEMRALKVINPELLGDQLFVKRFMQEAVIARKLDHPNAVRVDDIDESEDGRPFMVMEYIEGESLKSLIQSGGSLPLSRVCSIIKQVAAALDAAHHLGMVHRDIKPANIVLIQTPEGEQAKVLDFGIAKFKKAHGESSEMTLTGTDVVIGTPQYMSPEQAIGKRGDDLDGRSDIYSLGVVMYQMLAGSLPFKADTTMGLLLAHISSPPKPLLEARPDLEIPPSLAAVVMKCLEKNPAARPQTGAALVEELDRAFGADAVPVGIAAASSLETPSATAASPVTEFGATQVLAPDATPAGLKAPTATVPLAASIGTAAVPPPAPAGPATSPAPKRKLGWAVAAVIIIIVAAGAGFGVWRYRLQHAAQQPATPQSSTPPPASTAGTSATQAPATEENPASNTSETTPAPSTNEPSANAAAPETTSSKALEGHSAREHTATSKPALKSTSGPVRVAEASPPKEAAVSIPRPSGPAGDLILSSAAGAQVYLDGKSIGTIGSTGRLAVNNVAAGAHKLRVGYPGFQGFEYDIHVASGGTSFVTAKAEGTAAGPQQAAAKTTPAAPVTVPAAARSSAPAPAAKSATFEVTHPHVFGSCHGPLLVANGSISYHASNGKDSFHSSLTGSHAGINHDGNFYIRLKNGKEYTFRSESASAILQAIRQNAGH